LIQRTASICYEEFIEAALLNNPGKQQPDQLDLNHFKQHQDHYTIVDIRNTTEIQAKPIFANALNIPLGELRENTQNIPTQKPIIVHCAGGYRSAAGSSIIKQALK